MIKTILSILTSFTVFPVAVYSIQRFSPSPLGSTAFWWLVQIIILIIFFAAGFVFFKRENKKNVQVVSIYLAWVVFSILRGIFIAEIYWDWKGLISNSFALFIPIIVYTVSNKEQLQTILSFYVKFAIPLAMVFALPISFYLPSLFLYPIAFLFLFFPVLKNHWKIGLMLLIFIGLIDFSARSNLVKYSIPILLVLLAQLRFFIASDVIIKIGRKVLIIAPWLLFALGVSGIFNVFNFKEYIQTDYVAQTETPTGEIKEQSITDDSRTFIYREVLQSAQKYNYWLLGRSPARGNETVAFAEEKEEITGRRERLKNEANIPNVFTYMGVIGVLLYSLVFYKASALAIYKSNNIYSKLIGFYVAFRWAFAWIEDPYRFDMNSFTIWIMIGICFSESFRKMNNFEMKLWARGIFDKKYIGYLNYLKKDNPKGAQIKMLQS